MSEKDNIEKLMKEKEVQFRDFKIATRKTEDSEDYVLEGVACNFNKETVLYKDDGYELRETISPDAFNECDMSDVIFNYNHCGRVFARTRNNTLKLQIEPDGLHIRAILRKDDRGHKELYEDIKAGTIDKMSFAFHVEDSSYSYSQENDNMIERCLVTKIDKLYDVSAVDIPAYDTTSISARRAFDAEREKRKAESEKRERMLIKLKIKLGGIK